MTQCKKDRVSKFTPQGNPSGNKTYLITRYLLTLTCTWSIGIGYPINTETYPPF